MPLLSMKKWFVAASAGGCLMLAIAVVGCAPQKTATRQSTPAGNMSQTSANGAAPVVSSDPKTRGQIPNYTGPNSPYGDSQAAAHYRAAEKTSP